MGSKVSVCYQLRNSFLLRNIFYVTYYFELRRITSYVKLRNIFDYITFFHYVIKIW